MKKFAILTIIALMAIISCNNEPVSTPEKKGKTPGKFSATVLSDTMGNNSARSVSLGTYTITNSKSIFFILRNVGDFPITGVAITPGKLIKDGTFQPITDNAVTASPSAITVLETSGNTTVESVIEVNINHGNVVGLIAQQYIQKADFAGTTLRITGKTRDEAGAVLDVSLDVDIETLIKVASFELHYSEDNGVTYRKAGYGNPAGAGPNNWYFLVPLAGKDNIKIFNSGNVPLRYKARLYYDKWAEFPAWQSFFEWITLEAGSDSGIIPFLFSGSTHGLFLIDTIGIVFDNDGIENLVFRPGTSIVIDESNEYYSELSFFAN